MVRSDQLNRAIGLVRAGKREEARELLQRLVAEEPTNEKSWLWLVETLPDDTQRVAALEMCLRFNPDSALAKRGLEMILGQRMPQMNQPSEAPQKPPDENITESISESAAAPAVEFQIPQPVIPPYEPDLEELIKPVHLPAASRTPPLKPPPRRKRRSPAGAVLLILLIGGLAFFGWRYREALIHSLASLRQPAPTATLRVITATPGPTLELPTPAPTFTPTFPVENPEPTLPVPTPRPGSVRLSPDNAAGAVIARTQVLEKVSGPMILSPQHFLLAVPQGSQVTMIDLESGRTFSVLRREVSQVDQVAISPDSRLAATRNQDRTVFLWDIKAQKQPVIFRFEKDIKDVRFTADNRYLAVQIGDESIRFYLLETNQEVFRLDNPLDPLRSAMRMLMLPDGRLLLALQNWEDLTTRILRYDLPPGEPELIASGLTTAFNVIELSESGNWLIAAGDGAGQVFDLKGEQPPFSLRANPRQDNRPLAVFAPFDLYVMLESNGVEGKSWPELTNLPFGQRITKLESEIGELTGMAISPDGKLAALAGKTSLTKTPVIEIYDAIDGNLLTTLPVSGEPGKLEFSIDGAYLYSYAPGQIRWIQIPALR